MWLVDTSVWIATFRRGGPAIDSIVPFDEIVTVLPVVQEVLQGFSDRRAFETARDAMLALPMVESPVGGEVFVEAAELYRTARRAGITVRSSIDCLIAACAIRNQLSVAHIDRDFDALARVSTLEAMNVRTS